LNPCALQHGLINTHTRRTEMPEYLFHGFSMPRIF
jgi:hypothetical protein